MNIKKWILTAAVCILSCWQLHAEAQIRFRALSWQQALAKARQENKMMFIALYAPWCGYCRQMEQAIYRLPEVGNFYNEQFINVKYNIQHTDGIAIRNSYTLPGLPAYLYLNPHGMVVAKTAGYQHQDLFIRNADSAISLYLHPPARRN